MFKLLDIFIKNTKINPVSIHIKLNVSDLRIYILIPLLSYIYGFVLMVESFLTLFRSLNWDFKFKNSKIMNFLLKKDS